jgi:CheY-like chemotaxis protein
MGVDLSVREPDRGQTAHTSERLMQDRDAAAIAQFAQRLGLMTEPQLEETWEEVGRRNTDPFAFLRVAERKGYLTPYQTHKLLKGEEDGYFLGGYRILYKISSGSFGRVYRADDPATGRIVAIKVLRRRWSEDPQRIELFEREGRLGMGLHHPNIVEMLAVNHDATTGQYYIVMEFVEGGNLREMLAIYKKLEPKKALHILEDAVGGLAHAFARGLTHRDIKLTNLLISSSGSAKVVDFGLAKVYAGAAGEDEEKVERTVDYAGLERATGVKAGDVRSDIFFLGCVTYEMLTGRPPLTPTRDRHARMAQHRFTDVPPMSRDEVEGPPSLFLLVETMMSLDPQRRYQTPSQLLDAIRAVRRELEADTGGGGARSRQQTVFVVQKDDRLRETIKEKLKELGYRVLAAGDPMRALDRFRQQPFDALIVDCRTTDEDGLIVYDRILLEAKRQELTCAGILILAEEQASWAQRVEHHAHSAVMVPPVKLKPLLRTLGELLDVSEDQNL